MTTQPKKDDDLIDDLFQILNTNTATPLLERLVIYVQERDHKILQHGIKLGKEQQV